MQNTHGTFTISLDFELYWGMRDIVSIEEYKDYLLGAREAIPKMLELFEKYDVHATWATVGFLFFDDRKHLGSHLPKETPSYLSDELSPYPYIENADKWEDVYHFAPDLVDAIHHVKGQEVATHTFSHYYCGEEGQSLKEFEVDIQAAISIANEKNIETKSIIFPRNQWNPDYLPALEKLGVTSFRGAEASWMYSAPDYKSQLKPINRAARLADAYINLSGHNTYSIEESAKSKPYNFPSSRQLRPYSKKLALLDGLRLKRITKAMSYAAKHNEIFHIWWHPHNFGTNIEKNLSFLEQILIHYQTLQASNGMRSLNMKELSAMAVESYDE
ncbi:MAG: polysaccharide deacetylase [uncultured Thiotrichaceae bacterium]|uniref:Polysaccharide deacetylase n=1 Tax=uncultured Thiotrichaceae bacterium TaxID=298394 RepID=A0A6S6TVT2_9GAMM|nr:MAG: polysaccharide deacetylase [uncultured Thiotrichaceae bacterium]